MCQFSVLRLPCEHPHKIQEKTCDQPRRVDHRVEIIVTDVSDKDNVQCPGCDADWDAETLEASGGKFKEPGAFAYGFPPRLWTYATVKDESFTLAYPVPNAFVAWHDLAECGGSAIRREGLHYCQRPSRLFGWSPRPLLRVAPNVMRGSPYSIVHVPNWSGWRPGTRTFEAIVPCGMNARLLTERPDAHSRETTVLPQPGYSDDWSDLPKITVYKYLDQEIEKYDEPVNIASATREGIKDYNDPLVVFGCVKEVRRCLVDKQDYLLRKSRRLRSEWHGCEMKYIPEAIDFDGWKEYKKREPDSLRRTAPVKKEKITQATREMVMR